MKIPSLVLTFIILSAPAAGALSLSNFTICIGANGGSYGSTCQLDPGISPVTSTLTIARNGLLIEGTVGSAWDAILQRSTTLGQAPIMTINSGLTVTIKYLTFDGNRQNISLCSTSDLAVADLDLWNAGLATIQYVDFIDAPWRTLQFGGSLANSSQASTVSYSNFGQGFNAHGISRTAPETAGRWTGVIIQGLYSGVWSNNFAYDGLAAIQVYTGTDQYIVGNTVNEARYEQPDGVSGGVIYIGSGPSGGAPSYTTIADNVLNGNYWTTTGHNTSNTDILCNPATGLYSLGIEASGNGHRYYNNSIIQHMAWGILLRPWDSSSTLNSNIISGWDPFCTGSCQFVPQYVENNGGCWTLYSCYNTPTWPAALRMAGINVNTQPASGSGGTGTVSNLTLDHVRSVTNSRYGVSLDSVTGTPGFIDSVNGGNKACIQNNGSSNLVATNDATPYQSFTLLCP